MRCINADIKVPSQEARRVCCPFSPGLDLSDSNHRATDSSFIPDVCIYGKYVFHQVVRKYSLCAMSHYISVL